MYFHPKKPDPYHADRADEREDFGAFLIASMFVAAPLAVGAFCLGYMSGVWGWI